MWIAMVALAQAAPMSLMHSGRLLTADGAVVHGERTVVASLHAGETAAAAWTGDPVSVDVQDGYFAVVLAGGSPPLDSELFAAPELWVAVSVDGTELSRARLHSVPYALRARTAEGVPLVGAQPAGACADGAVHYDTGAAALRVCAGGAWQAIAPPAAAPSLSCTCATADTTATLGSTYTRTGGGCYSDAANERQILRTAPSGAAGWNCRTTDEDQCRAETLTAYACGCRVQ
jgi:hypothetical protein